MLERLLQCLADGRFHSGSELGRALGMSRSAIWKHIRTLESLGVEIFSVRGRGYRIPGGLDLLDLDACRAALLPQVSLRLEALQKHLNTASTNLLAAQALREGVHHGVYVAEQQTEGRGRRGRRWFSPFAANLYMSLAWRMPLGLASLEGLSLAVALALRNALIELGCDAVKVKWPNDLLIEQAKLAGILIEVSGDTTTEAQLVIGIGINVTMMQAPDGAIDQAWTSLQRSGVQVSRTHLLACVLNHLILALEKFEREGFVAFQSDWQNADAFYGQRSCVISGEQVVEGICLGVNEMGALQLETEQGRLSLHGGELSLRAL
ncbi:bifunctional biotin--[acetyl-CoA-carboxylase] ligase/biotin operon repressor BirA [Nitrincola tapanii]|uniref:bifunctional biotin--[acetyl-CoA-carboxylase] ligase/biotin operon repressor BirA n=1 Tax=Nitrincola tapanii TaxID=1708751 RepID=UPI001F2152EA|nr:bifunctional biotin--[acetyl-CoA-carboxylase] ligase/biotin operon repressor BirA [Nitrincola tapanii]